MCKRFIVDLLVKETEKGIDKKTKEFGKSIYWPEEKMVVLVCVYVCVEITDK